jgi:phage tail-like protein
MSMATTARSPSNQGSKTTDPVGELRFQVKLPIPGSTIGRFQECTGLAADLEVKEYAEGGVNDFMHKLPTRVKWPNLVLKRGVTHEKALLAWFWATRTAGLPANVLDEVTIQLMGPGSQLVRTWTFWGAFPVKWTGPNLNAGSNSIATEQLEIAHKGLTQV